MLLIIDRFNISHKYMCMSADLPLGKKLWKIRTRSLDVAGRGSLGRRGAGLSRAVGRGTLGRGAAFSKTLLTQHQLDLELPQILAGESYGKLNGEYTFHSRLTVN